MSNNVRVGCDDLLFWRELGALFEFEVANGTREGKIAVDSAKVNEPSCSTNSCFLACSKGKLKHPKGDFIRLTLVLGLVVVRQRFCSALHA